MHPVFVLYSLFIAPDISQLLLGFDIAVTMPQNTSVVNTSEAHVHVQVVNKVRGKLSKLERKTLSALIVVDVHARDVATELAAQGVSSETDFEWMSQLRWVERSYIIKQLVCAPQHSIGLGLIGACHCDDFGYSAFLLSQLSFKPHMLTAYCHCT